MIRCCNRCHIRGIRSEGRGTRRFRRFASSACPGTRSHAPHRLANRCSMRGDDCRSRLKSAWDPSNTQELPKAGSWSLPWRLHKSHLSNLSCSHRDTLNIPGCRTACTPSKHAFSAISRSGNRLVRHIQRRALSPSAIAAQFYLKALYPLVALHRIRCSLTTLSFGSSTAWPLAF